MFLALFAAALLVLDRAIVLAHLRLAALRFRYRAIVITVLLVAIHYLVGALIVEVTANWWVLLVAAFVVACIINRARIAAVAKRLFARVSARRSS